MTTKYVKNPIIIDSVEFNYQNKDLVLNWAKSIQFNVYHGWDENGKPAIIIPTSEGEMMCRLGDYIIVEPFPTDDRKLYPCKKDVFEKTYMRLSKEA